MSKFEHYHYDKILISISWKKYIFLNPQKPMFPLEGFGGVLTCENTDQTVTKKCSFSFAWISSYFSPHIAGLLSLILKALFQTCWDLWSPFYYNLSQLLQKVFWHNTRKFAKLPRSLQIKKYKYKTKFLTIMFVIHWLIRLCFTDDLMFSGQSFKPIHVYIWEPAACQEKGEEK